MTIKLEDYHITSLTPFLYDAEADPRLIVNKDSQMWDVERVIAHRGDPAGSKKQLFFHVKWVGYDDEANTREPWENLRDNICATRRLKSLIPTKFRERA